MTKRGIVLPKQSGGSSSRPMLRARNAHIAAMIHEFQNAVRKIVGACPGKIVEGGGSTLYGMTWKGGAGGNGEIFSEPITATDVLPASSARDQPST